MASVLRVLASLALSWRGAYAASWIPSYAGSFIMYMDRMYLCSTAPKENMFDCHIRPSHFRNPALIQTSLQTLDGNFTWKAAVDDTWAGMVKMDVWSSNQWKENSILYRIPRAYCSTVRSNFPGLYETFYKTDAWSKAPCTFPQQFSTIENKTINWTLPNFPVLPFGRFKCTNTVWTPKKDKMACFVFELIIVPRLNKT